MGILIDRAEHLRRHLRDAARDADWPVLGLRRTRQPDQLVAPAGAVASWLDTATDAIRPLPAGLRQDDRIPSIAPAALRATGRFLISADTSLAQMAERLRAAQERQDRDDLALGDVAERGPSTGRTGSGPRALTGWNRAGRLRGGLALTWVARPVSAR